jgi:hypothetical protein
MVKTQKEPNDVVEPVNPKKLERTRQARLGNLLSFDEES